jgi:glycosyltransferase involved in cell wall biosynthesis
MNATQTVRRASPAAATGLRVLNVVVTTPDQRPGGAARAGLLLGDHLAAYAEVTNAKMESEFDADLPAELDLANPVTRLPARTALRSLWDRLLPSAKNYSNTVVWTSLAGVDLGSYDVVHLHNSVPLAGLVGAALACRRAGVPYVVTTHEISKVGAFPTEMAMPAPARLAFEYGYLPAYRRVLRGAAHLFALSASDADLLRETCPGQPVSVVPNGVRLPEPVPDAAARVADLTGVPPDCPLLLFVGALMGGKGVDDLLAAHAALATEADLVVVGPVVEEAYRDRVTGVPGVHHLGYVSGDDLRGLYARADLFVFPTRSDVSPLVNLEAMAAGLAVVSTRVGGIPEQVTPDVGVLVPPRDPAAVAAAVDDLLADPARRARLGAAARERARGRFSWDAAARRVAETYARLPAVRRRTRSASREGTAAAATGGPETRPGAADPADLPAVTAPATSTARGDPSDRDGRPLRIAHVQHPYLPGLGYQENHLPAQQRALGHAVAVFTSDHVPAKFRSLVGDDYPPGEYEHDGVAVRRLDTWLTLTGVDDVALRSLPTALDAFRPDVIHAHELFSLKTVQAMRYARSRGVPLVVDFHVDNDNFHPDTPLKRAALRAFEAVLLPQFRRTAAAFLPVNPLAERMLVEDLAVPASQVELLTLGVDDAVFHPDGAAGAAYRSALGLAPDDPLVVTAGNLDPTKDVDVLLAAFARVAAEFPAARLAVVGDGADDHVAGLRTLAADLGLADRVHFTGPVDHADLPAVYNAADVGVWPGKLGITILEAVGTGLPVVVSDTPATTFLTAGGNGRTVDRGDVDAVAAHLRAYLGDPDLRAAHAAAAAEYAATDLSWRRIAEQSVAVYRRVL